MVEKKQTFWCEKQKKIVVEKAKIFKNPELSWAFDWINAKKSKDGVKHIPVFWVVQMLIFFGCGFSGASYSLSHQK